MKQLILIFSLSIYFIFPSLAQETPIKLVKRASDLTKDSLDLVQNKKELIKETQALIKDIQGLSKDKKKLRLSNQNSKFQIGLTYQVFTFSNYKSVEGEGTTKLVEPDNFNGFALGFTFRKHLNEHLSLKSELIYAKQDEKFIYSTFSFQDFDRNRYYLYNAKINIEYGQVKLPILADYKLKFGTKSTWALHSYLGGQITFLANYKITDRVFQVYSTGGESEIIEENIESEWIITSGYGRGTDWDYSTGQAVVESVYNPSDKIKPFRRFLFGMVGGLEIEKMLSPSLALGFGFRYDYNLSITENKDYGTQVSGDYSHQKRIGMTLSLLKTIH
jgi:hypothetical protein